MPSISAILPCYNHAKFIGERLNSVLSQTRPVDEIILLDDASTDNSLSLAKSILQGTAIPYLVHSSASNSGSPFSQWNKGISLATSDLIWIAETDDSCHPRFLEVLVQALDDPSIGLAFCESELVDDKGMKLGLGINLYPDLYSGLLLSSRFFNGPSFVANQLSFVNLIPNASAVVFSRDLFNRTGSAPASMRCCGDWLTWINIAKLTNISFVAEPLNLFRFHQTTTRHAGKTDQYLIEDLACRLAAALPSVSVQSYPLHLNNRDLFSLLFFYSTHRSNLWFLLDNLPVRLFPLLAANCLDLDGINPVLRKFFYCLLFLAAQARRIYIKYLVVVNLPYLKRRLRLFSIHILNEHFK